MTQEDKQLLLIDLCARLPYHVICRVITFNDRLYDRYTDDELFSVSPESEEIQMYRGSKYNYPEEVKPFLRPMSSMTEEERKEYDEWHERLEEGRIKDWRYADYIGWLNSHHFDYRGLIKKGLAVEVTEENNPYK